MFSLARNDIQHASVQYILDSVIEELVQNPERRFIYVEIAFFWRWWNQQSNDTRNIVKELVNAGRLEFISGGWCMHDEATTYYNSIIDQHTLGAEFLRDQFGECARPKIGWQIDPFGHSREVASLFAQMGFDGLFFARADYQDSDLRNSTKTMEMIWKGSANLGRQSWLFTGLLADFYDPPDSLCFDRSCGDQPIIDDPSLNDYNVPERVQTFINAAHDQAYGFATNHIMMTMGSDFHYENANLWFKNLDKLIKYVNAQQTNGSDVNVFYSTPSCYVYALNKVDRAWTSKTDDFFPLGDTPHGFWTGYFTSRAALKRYERHSNNILQATRQLNALSQINLRNDIFYLSEAMGIVQHHDAISGTEKQNVADDYAQRLSEGIDKAAFTLTLWNPTIHPIIHHVRVPVTKEYLIRDPMGSIVPAEYVPISTITRNIPGRKSSAQNQYIFTTLLPALGFSTYYFEAKSFAGNNSRPEFQSSGAYVFRPLTSKIQPVSTTRTITCTKTETVQSALIVFDASASQEVSLFHGMRTVEIEWTVGPVPLDDNVGKEIIIRYDTDIESASKYYTDANGREVLERIRNYRPTWNYSIVENVSGNYYPINSRIWIKDHTRQLTVLTDRSEGGASIQDGSIEIMVHRRIAHDDSLGINEPLNETAFGEGLVVRGKHFLILESPENSSRIHRVGAQQLFMHPIATYALPQTSYANYSKAYHQTWSALSESMPLNVHLLTLDQLNPKQFLIRVEHYFELNEDDIYSHPVEVDLQAFFKSLGTITDLTELTLGANMPLSQLHRLDWRTTDKESSHIDMSSEFCSDQ
ncbi:unnamed protein product [Adineta steineri]|uniref:alpha-mannosidase n=1 Tax=Adineta steineri TaxID=433720 RepID=A0A814B5Y8_9BILA|nr:unnamed protein product [Adineta steineri]